MRLNNRTRDGPGFILCRVSDILGSGFGTASDLKITAYVNNRH